MTTLPKEPFGLTIFCDDAREELTGKVTLIGVYGDTMSIPGAPPSNLHQLMLAVHYVEPINYDEKAVSLRVIAPGYESPILDIPLVGTGPRAIPERIRDAKDAKHVIFRGRIPLSNLVIKAPGRLRVEIVRGKEVIRAGALNITFFDLTDEAQDGVTTANDPTDK